MTRWRAGRTGGGERSWAQEGGSAGCWAARAERGRRAHAWAALAPELGRSGMRVWAGPGKENRPAGVLLVWAGGLGWAAGLKWSGLWFERGCMAEWEEKEWGTWAALGRGFGLGWVSIFWFSFSFSFPISISFSFVNSHKLV